jgi:hypothetical protein
MAVLFEEVVLGDEDVVIPELKYLTKSFSA